MALTDEFEDRYSAQKVIELTNPDNPGGTSKNATRLANAAEDVQADFRIYCGVTFDLTDARHVAVAVEGVEIKLLRRIMTSGTKLRELEEDYRRRLRALAKVTGRDRVMPTTKSVLTPSDEQTGTETVRPDFDRDHFDDLIPSAPD